MASGIGNFFMGTPASTQQVQKYNPAQQNLISQSGMGALGALGKTDFAPIAQQARTNFAQNTIPSIAERFSGLGAQRSNAFGQQLGQAASGLEQGLAGLESSHYRDLLSQLMGPALSQQFDTIYNQRQPGAFEKGGNALLEGLKYLPLLLMGGPAAAGAGAGGEILGSLKQQKAAPEYLGLGTTNPQTAPLTYMTQALSGQNQDQGMPNLAQDVYNQGALQSSPMMAIWRALGGPNANLAGGFGKTQNNPLTPENFRNYNYFNPTRMG